MSPVLLAAAAAAGLATGLLADGGLDELSGLAVSRADPAVLWGHNDTGGRAELFRIGPDGEALGRVQVPGAQAGDWEDIAAFADAGGPALLVADTGDNFGLRSYATLYAVRDPGRGATAELLWRVDFRFPDGGHDCEAVAVDPLRREILLLTKRDRPAQLYRLPLYERAPAGQQVAERVGDIAPLPQPRGLRDRFAHMPTALDISADGGTAVIVTPSRAYVYRRAGSEPWIEAFRRPGRAIALPRRELDQIEAAALSADGAVLTVGSEGSPGGWARLELR